MSQCDPSSKGLADLLEVLSGDILLRWQERVRKTLSPQTLSPGELIDTLPEFLKAVVAALRASSASGSTALSAADTIAESHGAQRFRMGLDISTVVGEYSVLREVIFELIEERACPLEPGALRLLLDTLATAGAEALRRYAVEHEQMLRASEAKLQDIIDHAPAVISAKDTEGRYLFVNRSFEEVLGARRQEIVGRTDYDCFSREVADYFRATDAQVLTTGQPLEVEEEVPLADGPHLWRSLKFPLPRTGAPPYATCCISTDITERRRAEEGLRQSETRYRLATLATSDAIWDWDIGSGQVHWSENIYRLTRRAAGEVAPAFGWWVERVHPEDRERVVRGLYAAVEGGEAHWMDEYRFQRADGSYMFVNDRGYVVRDAQGRAVRMVGALQDVTEHKLAEQEARRRAGFEQHLIGIVSHDLRNPLNAILMAATLLLKREGLDEPQRRSLERIHSSAQRATRMLSDLLDFTQARLGGGIPVVPRRLDLHELTRQVVEEVQLAHPHQRIALEQSGDGRGEWDGDRLAQLITNLVNNALTYGQEHGTVRVRTVGRPDAVLLSVHNMGAPIPAELMSQLFQPLRRGEGKGSRGGHSIGLGLFIVKHIVDAHRGSIRVDSSVENGTTFTVCLPRRPSQAPLPPCP